MRLEGVIRRIVRGAGIRVGRKPIEVAHHLTVQVNQQKALELPEVRGSYLIRNPVAGIQPPMKPQRQAVLQLLYLNAKSLQGLQVLERGRPSLPVGLPAGGRSDIGEELAIVHPGHKQCQAQ